MLNKVPYPSARQVRSGPSILKKKKGSERSGVFIYGQSGVKSGVESGDTNEDERIHRIG